MFGTNYEYYEEIHRSISVLQVVMMATCWKVRLTANAAEDGRQLYWAVNIIEWTGLKHAEASRKDNRTEWRIRRESKISEREGSLEGSEGMLPRKILKKSKVKPDFFTVVNLQMPRGKR